MHTLDEMSVIGIDTGKRVTYTTPMEKTNTRPIRCRMGSRTFHNVRAGQRKMSRSLELFKAWVVIVRASLLMQTCGWYRHGAQ